MNKFYTKYVYIGFNFLYPLLQISEIQHRVSVNNVYLYSSECEENIDNNHLLCTFNRVTDALINHKNYVKSLPLPNKKFLVVFKLDEDIGHIIRGNYSKLKDDIKKKILKWHYGNHWETNDELHLKKCLYPENFREEAANELGTNIESIRELCNKIDIGKESLIIF